MIRFFGIYLIVFSMSSFCLAFNLSDKKWRAEDYQELFLPNLLINGNFDIQIDSPVDDPTNKEGVQIRKCWTVDRRDVKKVRLIANDSSISFDQNSALNLVGKTLVYKDTKGLLDNLRIIVDGKFGNPEVKARVGYCHEVCKSLLVPLKLKEGKLFGFVGHKLKGAQIVGFSLLIERGVQKIKSIRFGIDGQYRDLSGRDYVASEYCIKPPFPMGKVSIQHLVILSMLSLLSVLLIYYTIFCKEWFFAIITSTYLSFSFFGLWALIWGGSSYRLAQGIVDHNQLVRLGLINFSVLALLNVPWIFLRRFVMTSRPLKKSLQARFVGILYVCLIVFLAIITMESSISYFMHLVGCDGPSCATLLSQMRQDTTDLGIMKPHYQRLFFYYLTTFLSYFLIVSLLQSKVRGGFLYISLLMVIQSFVLIYNGEKAPVLWYLLGVLFILFECGRIYRTHHIFCILVGFAIGPSILTFFDISLADRLSLGSLTVGYKILQIFPSEHDYLGGASVISYVSKGIFGKDFFDLTFYLWRYIHPELVFSTIEGTSISAFWSESYANYGYVGVLLSALLLGVGLFMAQIYAAKFLNASSLTAIVAWLLFRYSIIAECFFSSLLFDFYLLGILATLVLLVFLFGSSKNDRRN